MTSLVECWARNADCVLLALIIRGFYLLKDFLKNGLGWGNGRAGVVRSRLRSFPRHLTADCRLFYRLNPNSFFNSSRTLNTMGQMA